MKRKRTVYEEDDGETIVDMNVDGMPWYRPKKTTGDSEDKPQVSLRSPEGRAALRGGALAGLLFVALFVGVGFLLIVFCEKVWLK